MNLSGKIKKVLTAIIIILSVLSIGLVSFYANKKTITENYNLQESDIHGMSIVLKQDSRQYLFGGDNDVDWIGSYTGGTNSGVGKTTISNDYLECSTWGTWCGYEIATVNAVELSNYSKLVFEFEEISRNGYIWGSGLWLKNTWKIVDL